jgi:hypothetical protein
MRPAAAIAMAWFFVFVVVLGIPTSSLAKGITTKIIITGTDLPEPIDLTDRAVLGRFSVWSGPGTFMNGIEGTDGFIIDWPSGAVTERPTGLRHYQVSFFVKHVNRPLDAQEDQLAYVVLYDYSPTTGEAFIYLPGKNDEWYRLNASAIFRGREGNWFRPTSAWQQVVTPLITRAVPR